MPTKGKGAARQYLQSEGNLALADESLGLAQQPKTKHLSPVKGVAQGGPEKETVGAVFSVRMIIALVGLSLILWCLVVLIMYWIRLRL
jgi:hypothetical protein